MIRDIDFIKNKKKVLEKLEQAKKEKLVDVEIIPILDIINSFENLYTSSSCYGRIVLLEIPKIGDKKNAKWLGKWHRTIKTDEVTSASQKAKTGQLWLLAQSLIIHIVAKTNSDAEKILKTAISSGFKNSGIKSLGRKVVVEICSTERLDAPVGRNGNLFCDEKILNLLVKIANDVIKRSNIKLKRLTEQLKKKI